MFNSLWESLWIISAFWWFAVDTGGIHKFAQYPNLFSLVMKYFWFFWISWNSRNSFFLLIDFLDSKGNSLFKFDWQLLLTGHKSHFGFLGKHNWDPRSITPCWKLKIFFLSRRSSDRFQNIFSSKFFLKKILLITFLTLASRIGYGLLKAIERIAPAVDFPTPGKFMRSS